ncbi:Mitochondrial carnitine/acylcarnitine carrier protein CACL [Fukomys damarensis]|uniref:Mitochondrial carnitine/acylcarnitine carrier protein CACL n=1 Tax=Fukomys damarensis TaxID=885580 RepID=A0A091CTP4_FUKDA|nr:Mitochondrial carnitine/acylcarnitine carrier protein CACL [Fukomys damarensis]
MSTGSPGLQRTNTNMCRLVANAHNLNPDSTSPRPPPQADPEQSARGRGGCPSGRTCHVGKQYGHLQLRLPPAARAPEGLSAGQLGLPVPSSGRAISGVSDPNSGVAGVLVGHPFDTVKVRLQVQSVEKPQYRGTLHCFQSIVRQESALTESAVSISPPLAGSLLLEHPTSGRLEGSEFLFRDASFTPQKASILGHAPPVLIPTTSPCPRLPCGPATYPRAPGALPPGQDLQFSDPSFVHAQTQVPSHPRHLHFSCPAHFCLCSGSLRSTGGNCWVSGCFPRVLALTESAVSISPPLAGSLLLEHPTSGRLEGSEFLFRDASFTPQKASILGHAPPVLIPTTSPCPRLPCGPATYPRAPGALPPARIVSQASSWQGAVAVAGAPGVAASGQEAPRVCSSPWF